MSGHRAIGIEWSRCLVWVCVTTTILCAGCTPTPTPTPTPSTSVSAQPVGDGERVAEALTGLATDPASLLASGAELTPKQAREAFPQGTTVAPDAASWLPDGTGSGGVIQVLVTRQGRSPVMYLAIMVSESGQWRVLATAPITAQPSPKATR